MSEDIFPFLSLINKLLDVEKLLFMLSFSLLSEMFAVKWNFFSIHKGTDNKVIILIFKRHNIFNLFHRRYISSFAEWLLKT